MFKLMNKQRNKKGFTLIELIVVIAILGILALVAIPRLTGFQEAARQKADFSNATTLASGISALLSDGQITASVTTAAAASGVTIIAAIFPNATVPTFQTTAVKDEAMFYTVDVSTGAVTISTGTTAKQIYPTPDATTFAKIN